jgi:hypothetical protein
MKDFLHPHSLDGASANPSVDGSTDADDEGFFTDDEDFGAAAALAWAEANGNDSLRIVCAYHKLEVPPRGGAVVFQPLDHLQPLAYERPAVIPASLTGGRHIDLLHCKVSGGEKGRTSAALGESKGFKRSGKSPFARGFNRFEMRPLLFACGCFHSWL